MFWFIQIRFKRNFVRGRSRSRDLAKVNRKKERENLLINLPKKKMKIWKYAVCGIKSKIVINEGIVHRNSKVIILLYFKRI